MSLSPTVKEKRIESKFHTTTALSWPNGDFEHDCCGEEKGKPFEPRNEASGGQLKSLEVQDNVENCREFVENLRRKEFGLGVVLNSEASGLLEVSSFTYRNLCVIAF